MAEHMRNPIPKGTKTINDMYNSQDTSGYRSETKKLSIRRRSTNKSRGNKDLNHSDYDSYNDNPISSAYESYKPRSRKKMKSMSKQRTDQSGRRLIPKGAGNYKSVPTHNDFDPHTVNEGLDEIDMMLDDLEQN